MPNYFVPGLITAVSTSLKTAAHLTRGSGRRAKIYEFGLSASAAPADNVLRGVAQRFTAAPTSTAITPRATDPGEPASVTTAGQDASAEGTYTASTELFDLDLNQRASFRWLAAPGSELVTPDTAANGIGIRMSSLAYTGGARAPVFFLE